MRLLWFGIRLEKISLCRDTGSGWAPVRKAKLEKFTFNSKFSTLSINHSNESNQLRRPKFNRVVSM